MAHIDSSDWGSVTIDGKRYETDVYLLPSGKVETRQKDHTITRGELERLLEGGTEKLVIGKGVEGVARLDQEAEKLVESLKIEVVIGKTPDIRGAINGAKDQKVAALIHTTC